MKAGACAASVDRHVTAKSHWRVLCLGNDLLADDAFAFLVASQVGRFVPDVVATPESGLALLDHLEDAHRLVVVDTVMTGRDEPGALHVWREEDVHAAPGPAPHYLGLLEVLALGRRLGLSMPGEVVLVAVEAADCFTLGGPMHPKVRAAVPRAADLIRSLTAPASG